MYNDEADRRVRADGRAELGEVADIFQNFHLFFILPYVAQCYYNAMHVLKFLIAGGIGLTVNLGVFHTLVVFGVPYLAGSVTAFLVSMVVGFVLQKYWTFEEYTHERTHKQFMLYAMIALCNLGVNTLIVYLSVEYVGAHYLVAQTIGAGSVALTSYFVYRRYIFPKGL